MKKLILLLLFIPVISFGQDQKLKVYLDCRCDDNYIKQKTSFLEYVSDQDLADIEIIIRDIRTPTGTRSFEIQIDGNNEFKKISSSALVSGFVTDTSGTLRDKLLNKLILIFFFFLEFVLFFYSYYSNSMVLGGFEVIS